jgi:hypothetical protein
MHTIPRRLLCWSTFTCAASVRGTASLGRCWGGLSGGPRGSLPCWLDRIWLNQSVKSGKKLGLWAGHAMTLPGCTRAAAMGCSSVGLGQPGVPRVAASALATSSWEVVRWLLGHSTPPLELEISCVYGKCPPPS